MNIRNKVHIINILPIILTIAVALTLFVSYQTLSRIISKGVMLEAIVSGVFEMNVLTADYLRYPADRAKEQWMHKYASIEEFLESEQFETEREKRLLNIMRNDHKEINVLFLELVNIHEKRRSLKDGISVLSGYEERLIGQMLIRLQSMSSNATRLSDLNNVWMMNFYRRTGIIVMSFVGGLMLVIFTVSFFLGKSIVMPITRLHRATEVIAGGNLDLRTGIETSDELGQLSRSFDKMTFQLKNSRTILEDEIAERKKAEEKLLLVQSSVDNSEESIFWITEDARFASVNKAACMNLGYSRQELLAMTVSDVDPNFPKEKWHEHWNELKRLGSMTFESLHKNKSGGIYPVEVKISFIRFGDSEYNFVFARDITERKKAEEQVRASLIEKEMLLKEIHHRVKNNMAVVSSLLNLQAAKVEDEHYREMFSDSISRIKTMALIHEKLYRSEDLTKINFSDYISDMADNMYRSYRLSSSKVRLKKDIEQISLGIDAAIPCGLIVNELLSNSLKHAFPDGREGEIKVALRAKDKEEVELMISDNGVGMPQALDFRSTDTLGLTLINALTGQLKGKIELNREQGTEFIITFRG